MFISKSVITIIIAISFGRKLRMQAQCLGWPFQAPAPLPGCATLRVKPRIIPVKHTFTKEDPLVFEFHVPVDIDARGQTWVAPSPQNPLLFQPE